MNKDIASFNKRLSLTDKAIVNVLAQTIDSVLTKAESKIWHAHPVWFLDGNPIVGYSKQKRGWRLMFWSGADFDEDNLNVVGAKFKDASIFYTTVEEINTKDLKRWLKKSEAIQWDYKNIVKRRGKLERLKMSETVSSSKGHDERIASMVFASVYPHYVTKVESKGRTKAELHKVIQWLTGFNEKKLQEMINKKVTFEKFFDAAKLNQHANLITGVICGYRVEDIKNPLTQKARYLDKLIDELAKGRKMEKILRG